MKSRAILGLLLCCLLVVAGSTSAEDKPAEAKALCPVSGKPVNMSVSTDYNGGKCYFCCQGCIAPFNNNTAKYAAKANEQGHLFGSVTARQIAANLRSQGFEVKDEIVQLHEHIKEVGTHAVTLKFGPEVTATVNVVDVPEQAGTETKTESAPETPKAETPKPETPEADEA